MQSHGLGLTRRSFAGGVAILLGSMTAGLRGETTEQNMQQPPPSAPGDPRTSLHQEAELASTPSRIENALLDAKQFAAFTGLAATIEGHEGGAFSLFGGLIVGRNVELVSGQRIVQAWRPTHWDPGVYSVVKFEFKPRGRGTLVVLDHTGFPAGEYDHLASGWKAHYWDSLKKFFA
jgi:activator of HSP90 ATPase